MSANIVLEKEIEITEKMIGDGLREFHSNRDFEHDWQVVARIYAAMKVVDPHARK